jgi:hypothetical protein
VKQEYTNTEAWHNYDLIIEDRLRLGQRISIQLLDKVSLPCESVPEKDVRQAKPKLLAQTQTQTQTNKLGLRPRSRLSLELRIRPEIRLMTQTPTPTPAPHTHSGATKDIQTDGRNHITSPHDAEPQNSRFSLNAIFQTSKRQACEGADNMAVIKSDNMAVIKSDNMAVIKSECNLI